MNMNNFAILKGRLVADPAVFSNKDGSSKVKFTLAVEDNYKGKDGKRGTQMIAVEAFTKDYTKSPFASIHKGDKIACECSLRNNNYEKADGTKVYQTVIFVENVQFEESKSVTEARAAANAAAAAPALDEAPAEAQA